MTLKSEPFCESSFIEKWLRLETGNSLSSILGDRHPATISKMTQLAEAHSKAGQTEEALMLNSEAALYKRQLYAPTAI